MSRPPRSRRAPGGAGVPDDDDAIILGTDQHDRHEALPAYGFPSPLDDVVHRRQPCAVAKREHVVGRASRGDGPAAGGNRGVLRPPEQRHRVVPVGISGFRPVAPVQRGPECDRGMTGERHLGSGREAPHAPGPLGPSTGTAKGVCDCRTSAATRPPPGACPLGWRPHAEGRRRRDRRPGIWRGRLRCAARPYPDLRSGGGPVPLPTPFVIPAEQTCV